MKKIFTFLIVVLPILSQYKSPIPKVDLGTFSICCIIPIILLKIRKVKLSKGNGKIKTIILTFCIYITLSTTISCMLLQNEINYFNIMVRTVKFIFLIITVICISYDYLFDFKFGIKVLKNITILSCLYIIAQTISFYILHTTLPGVLMNFIQQGDYSNITYESVASSSLYRPASFFVEPSIFSEYVILYFTYVLFNTKMKVIHKYIQAIIISIGLICSTSGFGYLCCALIWGIFFYKCYIKKINIKNLIIIIIGIIIIVTNIKTILNMPIVYQVIQRGVDGSQTGGNAFIGRIQSFTYLSGLDIKHKIIGMGYGNPINGKFMNSMSYILYCCGILGFLIITCLFIVLIKFKSTNESKNVFIFMWFISMFFITSFVAIKICFYLVFLLIEEDDENKLFITDRNILSKEVK